MQRRIFRIERMIAGRRTAAAPEDTAASRQAIEETDALRALAERRTVQTLERELAQLHETIAGNKRELIALMGERQERRMMRAAGELGAAIDGMEQATQAILQATESIDDDTKSLGASLKNDYQRGLTQDIQERVVEIYEACNFQDLAGQRITKAMATLTLVEQRLAAMLERCAAFELSDETPNMDLPAAGRAMINGPRLDDDTGHAEQHDIDALFN